MGAPPIRLVSTDWTPKKADIDVEMATHDTARFKKVGFDNHTPTHSPIEYESFRVQPLETTILEDEIPVSIGWEVAINGNAILESLEKTNLNLDAKAQEDAFVRMFNQVFWKALAAISTQEVIDSRNYLDTSMGNRTIFEINTTIIAVLIRELTQHPSGITFLSRTLISGILANLAEANNNNRSFVFRHFLNGGRAASNDWRQQHFPDRYDLENQDQQDIAHAATRFAPGGYIAEALMCYAYARIRNVFTGERLFRIK